MSISQMTNPRAIPTDENDYTWQNLLLSNFTCGDHILFEYDLGPSTFTIKVGSFFEYNNAMYEIDADIVFNNVRNYNPIYNRLSFDGRVFDFSSARRFFFNEKKRGYYSGNRKFFNVAYVKAEYNGVLRLKECEIGQVHIRLPGTLHPKYFYSGQWANITSDYANSFFRVKGKEANAYDGGVQEDLYPHHNHEVEFPSFQSFSSTYSERVSYSRGGISKTTSTTRQEASTDSTGRTGRFSSETRPKNESVQIFMCRENTTQVV